MTRNPEKVEKGDAGAAADPYEAIYENRRDRHVRFKKKPWSAYFYYFYKVNPSDALYKVKLYYYVSHHGKIGRNDLRTLITNLGNNARKNPEALQSPKPICIDTKWRRRSYFIALVDSYGPGRYKFVPGKALKFKYGLKENHTFFDGGDFNNIELDAVGNKKDEVSAVFCINHMKKNIDGYDIDEDQEQKFYFEFNPTLAFRIVPDNGGTNLGPPVPPPA